MANDVNVELLSVSWIDYSKEKSSSTVGLLQLADNTAYTTARAAYLTALDAVTLGTRTQYLESAVTRGSNLFPSNINAQREEKLKIRYQDNATLGVYQVTYPCLDKSAVEFVPNTDYINLTDGGAGAALKTAFEGIVASPLGNSVTILDAMYVGRST